MSIDLSDPREVSKEYLRKNKVLELFHNLGALLAFHKPSDPNAFLIEQIKRIEAESDENKFQYFQESDYKVMFGLLDPTRNGYITKEQYTKALNSLTAGGREPTAAMAYEGSKIDSSTYVSLM